MKNCISRLCTNPLGDPPPSSGKKRSLLLGKSPHKFLGPRPASPRPPPSNTSLPCPHQGLLQSARGFADQLTALGSLVTETGPQGLPHISLALPGSGLTWDAVLRLTEDQMETARGALERVRGTVLALKDQQTGQERQLREAQAQLQQATERAEADAAASERVKAAALEEQRGRLTALHSGALDEALAARTKVEAEAEMLLSRLCALESAAEQLKLQNDGLVDQGEAQRGTAQQLQLNIEILSTDLTQKSEQCEFLTLDLERARAQTKELEDEMERVQEHATALQVQLEHVRGDNRELQDEVEKCHGQGTALQLQLDQLTLELQAVGAERCVWLVCAVVDIPPSPVLTQACANT